MKNIQKLLLKQARLENDLCLIQTEIANEVSGKAREIIGYWHELVNKYRLTKWYPGRYTYSHVTKDYIAFKSYSNSKLDVELPIALLHDQHWKSTLNKQLKEMSQAEMWRLLSK